MSFLCRVKIPFPSWMRGELALGSPKTNPFSRLSGGFKHGSSAFKSPTLTTDPRCLLLTFWVKHTSYNLHELVAQFSLYRVAEFCPQYWLPFVAKMPQLLQFVSVLHKMTTGQFVILFFEQSSTIVGITEGQLLSHNLFVFLTFIFTHVHLFISFWFF